MIGYEGRRRYLAPMYGLPTMIIVDEVVEGWKMSSCKQESKKFAKLMNGDIVNRVELEGGSSPIGCVSPRKFLLDGNKSGNNKKDGYASSGGYGLMKA